MTINVTQDDIDKGLRRSWKECPVARAITRITGEVTIVGIGCISTNEGLFSAPQVVKDFVRKFDLLEEVQPFTFELV